ncbi:MAG: hypothetical protein ACREXY_04000 [Gammaproteobacteria bacterium]
MGGTAIEEFVQKDLDPNRDPKFTSRMRRFGRGHIGPIEMTPNLGGDECEEQTEDDAQRGQHARRHGLERTCTLADREGHDPPIDPTS